MNALSLSYFGINIKILCWFELNEEKVISILKKYLPGIDADNEEVDCIAKTEIRLIKADEKHESLKVIHQSLENVILEMKAPSLNEFTVLGLLKPALDYILSGKRCLYFLHSAGLWVGDNAVLLWGTRAAGKTTLIDYFKGKKYATVNDERIGLLMEGSYQTLEKHRNDVIPVSKLSLIIVPYIIPEGPLKIVPIKEDSFLYELFHETSISVRGLDAYQGNLILQSLDNEMLSRKRMEWCRGFVRKMKDNAFFVEGTVESIYRWINDYCEGEKR